MVDPMCMLCRFWQEMPEGGDAIGSGYYEVSGDGTGLCRRYPPVGVRPSGAAILDTLDAAGRAAWPITMNFDWCGEFAPDPRCGAAVRE